MFCYYLSDGLYITGGAINNGGIALQWLIEKILEENLITIKKIKGFIKRYIKIKPGADGLIFLPYILGERSPVWDENARGAFIGLTASHAEHI